MATSPPPSYNSIYPPTSRPGLGGTDTSRHRPTTSKESGSLTVIMLIVGIALWAAGASHGNPSMVLAGKILTGLSLVPLALTVAAICALPLVCCLVTYRFREHR
ncbi:MAG: hypothetical protein JSS62_05260 [Verrucomicrobia bacterium]|nr:hypothetical protein [Verrucomicrobiota bacterium]MBS0647443.1 hypothetical protein [Verrucomicrobiota bacterium]